MHTQPTPEDLARARAWAEGRARTFSAAQERELNRTSGAYFSGYGQEIVTYDEAWIERDARSLAEMMARRRVETLLAAE